MVPKFKYKLKHQNSLYQTLLQENLSIHVVVLNGYDLNENIPLNKLLNHAVISPLYTINNLVKDSIKYLKHVHNQHYHLWCLDFDDNKHHHFHCSIFDQQFNEISHSSLMDNDRHLIKEHLTITFKVFCKIKVPIKILNHHKEKMIELTVPYSNTYCIKQLINDTKRYIQKIYKNKVYIHNIEMIQHLSSSERDIPNSWNTPLLYHTIDNETNHLQSLQLIIILKHKNRKKVKYKKPNKFDKCLYFICF